MKSSNFSVLNKYRDGEFIQHMKNAVTICESYDLKVLQLDKRVNGLYDATMYMDSMFLTTRSHKLTPELQSLDKERSTVLKAIRSTLENTIEIGVPETAEAARLLLNNYFVHGRRIERLQSQQKTAIIHAMMNDWASEPVLLQSVEKVKLNDWVTILTTKNSEFNAKYVQRSSTRIKTVEISSRKKLAKTAYLELIQDLESYARVSADNTTYVEILDKLSALRSDYKTSVVGRLSDRKKPVDFPPAAESVLAS
jgi:hypothetical protein